MNQPTIERSVIGAVFGDEAGSSINKIVPVDLAVVGDAGRALDALIAAWADKGHRARDLGEWWRRIDGWRATRCLDFPEKKDAGAEIMPQRAVKALFDATRGRDPIITTEVGQHQMWAAQHFGFSAPNRWLTSGGLGTMGYGFPAAVGAQIAHPDKRVVHITGDGAMGFNIQEFDTQVRHGLPVLTVVCNNQLWGMSAHGQDLIYGRDQHVITELRGTRYADIAQAMTELVADPLQHRGRDGCALAVAPQQLVHRAIAFVLVLRRRQHAVEQ